MPLARFTVSPDRSNRCNPYYFRVSPVPSGSYFEVSSLDETEPTALTTAALQLPDDHNPHAYQTLTKSSCSTTAAAS